MLRRFFFNSSILAFNSTILASPSLPVELVQSYYSNQQQEKAFKAFLDLLQLEVVSDEYHATDEEQKLYQAALALYLEAKGAKCQEGSRQILAQYVPIIEKHPEYSKLAYIVAAAYANQGKFLKYFEVFYHAYQRHPHHFLAYKTKAILWIKLFERESPGKAKEIARRKLLEELYYAVKIYPQDTSLYRLMILYASSSEKSKIVLESLNKIIHEDIIISRAELEFYMQQALSLNDRETTLRFIDKASQWYHFSRVIEAARAEISAVSTFTGRVSVKRNPSDEVAEDKGVTPAVAEAPGAADEGSTADRKQTEKVNTDEISIKTSDNSQEG